MKFSQLFLILSMLFLMSCSAAYEQVKEIDIKNPKTFQQHLLYNYKENASFEAEKMHDWNSAKLYSEKALRALYGEKIYPEKIDPKIRMPKGIVIDRPDSLIFDFEIFLLLNFP